MAYFVAQLKSSGDKLSLWLSVVNWETITCSVVSLGAIKLYL
jgi:hypothetical protein